MSLVSYARKLGMDIAGLIPASRDLEGIVEMMLNATLEFPKPLTKNRLFGWHSLLFPTGRSDMQRLLLVLGTPQRRVLGKLFLVSSGKRKFTLKMEMGEPLVTWH